ncbi:MAG: DUF2189 domain-containing protein [Pseudomonadota bacterium]
MTERFAINAVGFGDIFAALAAGWRDFRAAPQYGLFFSSVYAGGGLLLAAFGAGTFTWTLVLSLGYPLVAPFAAVGLYEVSRRLSAGEPLTFRAVLATVWAERAGQAPWIGAILVIVFLFWSFFAHMSFALFLGRMPLTNITTSTEALMNTAGLSMIAFQIVVGAATAWLVFAITVISLPLIVDREVDFVTAMITSMKAVGANKPQMVAWAATIAALLFLAMAPAFLGLFVALPILGHATWHLYRRVIADAHA